MMPRTSIRTAVRLRSAIRSACRGAPLPPRGRPWAARGGAIALGHPLGMSGARLALTAAHGLEENSGKLALATMCVGVGQGVSLALERVGYGKEKGQEE